MRTSRAPGVLTPRMVAALGLHDGAESSIEIEQLVLDT